MKTKKPLDMKDRYSRQTILDNIGPRGQEALLKKKIFVVGCGALGTHITDHLARAGVGHITILDRDLVELNNLQRQLLFDENDVGQPKASTAAEKLRKVNSGIQIDYLVKDLNSSNIEDLISGHDLVLDGTDNIPTRMLVNDACVKLNIPWIYAGVIQTRGMVMTVRPGDGPCFRCLMPEAPPAGSMPTCETAGVINTIPSVIASIQCTEALKILMKKESHTHLIVYDIWEHTFDLVEIKQYQKCDCCVKKNFSYLDMERREIVKATCDNGVQIIPAADMNLDLEQLAKNIEPAVGHVMAAEFLMKFEAEGKLLTLFKDGRAIIKGTGDTGAAKSFYTRYLGI